MGFASSFHPSPAGRSRRHQSLTVPAADFLFVRHRSPVISSPRSLFLPTSALIRWIASLAIFFLVVMTALRVATWLAFQHGALSLAQAAPAFWLGARFDLRVIASVMLALLVLGSIPWLNPFRHALARRGWLLALSAFGAGLVVLYTADFLHYRYLNQRLNASVLGYLEDARISAGMAWQTYPIVRIALAMVVAIAALAAVTALLHRRAAAVVAPPARRGVRVAWFAGVLMLCLLGIFGRAAQYPLRWSDAFNLRNDASAHLALNPFQSFLESLTFRTSTYDLAQVRAHYARMSDYLGVAAPDAARLAFERRSPGRADGAGKRPNVVLVICESFSAYKSSMWGNPLDTTPFFAELCRQGIFFDNCFTPHVGTARGVWATITGIPDVEPVETASRNPALVDQHTIIDDFEGYEKFYFLGGSSSWANIRGLLTNNIRDLRLYEEDSYDSPRIDVWGISDKNLFLEANNVLRKQTKPFIAVIQTADNHRPYTIPKEDLGAFQKVDVPAEALKRAGFESLAELNAFRYTDFAFKAFIEAARQAPYFDDTIFVFIGDHGIGGNAGTMFPPAWTEQSLTCYHVPLLFYAPKLLRPQRVHAVASMVDVLPTAAGLAGVAYRNSGLGRDLLRLPETGGRDSVAFVIDHHNRSMGVIRQPWFANFQSASVREDLVWADFAAAPAGSATPLRDEYRAFAHAFHETARYLLRHNKKASDRKGAEGSN
jgi:phosphoglycerol transferase MdoB-like AlkP superfamily enzyme